MARADLQTFDTPAMGPGLSPADAFFQLGLQYSLGREVAADVIDAHKWFNLAAHKGNLAAKEYRAELARDMSRAQVSEAQRRAREWLKAH